MQLHDRAQVFISCPSEENGARPTYVGTIERWLNNKLSLPGVKCHSNINLFILVCILILFCKKNNFGRFLVHGLMSWTKQISVLIILLCGNS